jgi:HEPN domain-containing protein
MARDHREWLKQAEYDLETAKFMHSGGRFFYIDESQEAMEWAKRQY